MGWSEFEDSVFDGEADVAVGFCEAADGFGFVDFGFEHDEGDGDAAAGGFDGVYGSLAVDAAGAHEDADAAFDELGVLHVYVDHEVFVDVAEACHGASGDHVEDHLLGGGGLHSGGAGDNFRADFCDDGDVSSLREGGVVIAGDGGGVCSAGSGVGDGGDDIGGASGGGDADDDVFAGGSAAGDVTLAEFFGVFVDFDGGSKGLGTAGHDVLDLAGSGGVGGRTLRGVECGDAAAGPCADVDEAAAVAEGSGDLVDDLCDFWQGLFDCAGNLGVFLVDDAGDFERGFCVKPLRGFVLALSGEAMKLCCAVYAGTGRGASIWSGRTAEHRVFVPNCLIVARLGGKIALKTVRYEG